MSTPQSASALEQLHRLNKEIAASRAHRTLSAQDAADARAMAARRQLRDEQFADALSHGKVLRLLRFELLYDLAVLANNFSHVLHFVDARQESADDATSPAAGPIQAALDRSSASQ